MITKNRIEWCIKESGDVSMRQAYLISGVSYPTFRKWTKRYGLWKPNQGGGKEYLKRRVYFCNSISCYYYRKSKTTHSIITKILAVTKKIDGTSFFL
jgi:hypothetical protein